LDAVIMYFCTLDPIMRNLSETGNTDILFETGNLRNLFTAV